MTEKNGSAELDAAALEERRAYFREYGRRYREKNRERIKAYAQQWRAANKERVKEHQARYWAKKAAEKQENKES